MLAGGVMLVHFAGLRRMARHSSRSVSGAAWIALVYLVFAGSIAGFTAYVWLLHHESPTKVGTYAYVNPVVAVIIGYFLGGEPLGARTVVGGMFVLASVVTITSMRTKIKRDQNKQANSKPARRKRPDKQSSAEWGNAQIAATSPNIPAVFSPVLTFGQLVNPFGRRAEVKSLCRFPDEIS